MIHYINLRVIAHSTEDLSRVRKALDYFLLNSAGASEDSNTDDAVEMLNVEGYYGNPITILSAQITRKSDSKAIANFIRQKMHPDDVQRLRSEMPDRLDDDQVFHIRLDKQAAFQEIVKLTSSSDAITVKVKIATYPKNRQKAGLIVEELFG
ncbi:RNA-binding protein [Methanolobus sp. ZRKC3]|uniref:RNA-binding protein n=1 Tax=Methanolobus sp. ZRKC3 TaxID=3125786 RepID=UPI003249783A